MMHAPLLGMKEMVTSPNQKGVLDLIIQLFSLIRNR
jgi:hypothetical protein